MAGIHLKITRREILTAALGGALVATHRAEKPAPYPHKLSMSTARMPTLYLPHGGGPWPFLSTSFGDPGELRALASYLRSLRDVPPQRPAAILVISAHWEEARPTVMTGARPPLLFDYHGFPPETYR
ncbi:MAG: hypothetical protein RMJ98_20430, partial [Myxococcales bacterium]|nr:hypothetical protein [Polyangiaceae bacterium]MDW8251669.1 hypothetical protein [Myxococcales bacterium]